MIPAHTQPKPAFYLLLVPSLDKNQCETVGRMTSDSLQLGKDARAAFVVQPLERDVLVFDRRLQLDGHGYQPRRREARCVTAHVYRLTNRPVERNIASGRLLKNIFSIRPE